MKTTIRQIAFWTVGVLSCVAVTPAQAASVLWAEWLSGTAGPSGSATGKLIDGSETVNVSYSGEIAFIQTNNTGTNYFIPTAPYISATVDNAPSRTDMIALSLTGSKTLRFDKPVDSLLFAVVSLNGNGYRFDRDFNILSFGNGFWGNGTLTKQDLGNGVYQLNGTGEPHGVIEFTGAITDVTWSSLTNEYWNGFNIGVRGVIIPEPAVLPAVLAPALLTLRRRRTAR